MKCFNHSKSESVGICKSCGKGLCHECCVEMKDGLACKNSCEERVVLINKMLDHNNKIISTSNKQLKNTGYFGIIAGLLFAALGVYFILNNLIFFGLIFVCLGTLYVISSIIRMAKKSQYEAFNEQDLEKKDEKN